MGNRPVRSVQILRKEAQADPLFRNAGPGGRRRQLLPGRPENSGPEKIRQCPVMLINPLIRDGNTIREDGKPCPIFFGERITVAGLITGQDLTAQLAGRDLGEELLLPANMLRSGENVFLDDMTVEQVEETLQIKTVIVESDGRSFVEAVTGNRIG